MCVLQPHPAVCKPTGHESMITNQAIIELVDIFVPVSVWYILLLGGKCKTSPLK